MTPSSEPAAAPRRWRPRARVVAAVLLAPLALALGLLIVLRTPWGMKSAVNLALRVVHPWDATASVSAARGNLFSRIELYGARLTRDDGSFDATADKIGRAHV